MRIFGKEISAATAGFPLRALRRGCLPFLLLALIACGPRLAAEEAPPPFLKGRLLVATEALEGSSFARTVIYMIEHDETGALGLVVNRPVGQVPVADLYKQLELPTDDVTGSILVHSGGPVAPGTVFVLHSGEFSMEGSRPVAPGLALSANPEILKAIGAGEGPEGYIFAFGYAGWAPGQLEDEIRRGSWVDIPAKTDLIFDKRDRSKWPQAIEAYSIEL